MTHKPPPVQRTAHGHQKWGKSFMPRDNQGSSSFSHNPPKCAPHGSMTPGCRVPQHDSRAASKAPSKTAALPPPAAPSPLRGCLTLCGRGRCNRSRSWRPPRSLQSSETECLGSLKPVLERQPDVNPYPAQHPSCPQLLFTASRGPDTRFHHPMGAHQRPGNRSSARHQISGPAPGQRPHKSSAADNPANPPFPP